MKIKLLALAAAALVSGAANAALIDIGTSNPNGYNGSVVFSMWDQNSAYELNLNTGVVGSTISGINTFVSDITAAGGSITFAADTLLTNWIASADKTNLLWNITAVNNGTVRSILTSANTAVLPTALSSQLLRIAMGSAGGIYTGINNNGLTATTNDVVIPSTVTTAYAGGGTFGSNFGNDINFSNASSALGTSMQMAVINVKSTGTALGSQAFDGVTATLATNGNLTLSNVAAVPEADSLAMLLAGLGAMGTIVRRRRNGAAA